VRGKAGDSTLVAINRQLMGTLICFHEQDWNEIVQLLVVIVLNIRGRVDLPPIERGSEVWKSWTPPLKSPEVAISAKFRYQIDQMMTTARCCGNRLPICSSTTGVTSQKTVALRIRSNCIGNKRASGVYKLSVHREDPATTECDTGPFMDARDNRRVLADPAYHRKCGRSYDYLGRVGIIKRLGY
jgi:hypothetical protein